MTEDMRPRFYRYFDMLWEGSKGDDVRIAEGVYIGVRRTRRSWWVVPEFMAPPPGVELPEGWRANAHRIEDYTHNGAGIPPRRFAYPDKVHAMQSLVRRKEAQQWQAARTHDRAVVALRLAKAGVARLKAGEDVSDLGAPVVEPVGLVPA